MAKETAKEEISRLSKENIKDIDKQIQENLREEPIFAEENTNTSGDDKPTEQTAEGEQQSETEENGDTPASAPKTRRTPDGISHAYDDIGLDDLNKPTTPKKKESKISGGGITPPNHKRDKIKLGDEKNIMELIWKEFILASYAGAIDFVVDNTLDFTEWVLFAPFKKSNKVKTETEPEGPKTIYAMGDEVFKSRQEDLVSGKNKFNEGYNELKENLSKEEKGEKPVWNIWKQEPSFWGELKDIAKKAKEDPNSEEAKIMAQFDKVPEMTENLLRKETGLFKIALNMATLEQVMTPIKSTVTPEKEAALSAMEQLVQNKDVSPDDLRKELKNHLKNLSDLTEDKSTTSEAIRQQLEKMQQIVNNTDKDPDRKDLANSLKTIRKIDKTAGSDESLIKENILKVSKERYKQITENIDKIHEAYADNPEEKNAAVKAYMIHLVKAVTEAKPAVDKIVSGGIASKLGSNRDKAKGSIDNIKQAIDNFQLKGENIGSVKKAALHIENPFDTKDKDQFLKNIRNYSMGIDR